MPVSTRPLAPAGLPPKAQDARPNDGFRQLSAPRDVLSMQPHSVSNSMEVLDPQGQSARVSLRNVAPGTGVWYVLSFRGAGQLGRGLSGSDLHLEVEDKGWSVKLDPTFPQGVVLESSAERVECPLWGSEHGTLAKAHLARSAYGPLCRDKLRLRGAKDGHRSPREWLAEFVRDRVPGGERLTNLVKDLFIKDSFLEEANREALPDADSVPPIGAPLAPLIRPLAQHEGYTPPGLGLEPLNPDARGRLFSGRWYALREQPGAFISVLQPGDVADEVVEAQAGRVNPLDAVEKETLAYLVAFDLERYDLNYGLGTEHPRVGWSMRAPQEVTNEHIPGPDGFGTLSPFQRTGRINPSRARDVVATFIGGFKLRHGAFHWGELSRVNGGSHYGFVEEGVMLSSLKPNLATAVVWNNGQVELKTWKHEDTERLAEVRYARQNGVPIVERSVDDGRIHPGAHVSSWSLGNWSGSSDKTYRTLRAGLCLQEGGESRFLIYAYFSGATASAMARVFQAYHCEYAMMLDMNALEHTYMALYTSAGGTPEIHHLKSAMGDLDRRGPGGTPLPRFLASADNRDFFYLTRKKH